MNQEKVLKLVAIERDSQDQKWGRSKSGNSLLWGSSLASKFTVLGEEVGEVARAILEKDLDNLLEELVQVAAVCVAIIEADF